jgi:acetyl-CoA acetyltransferase family protein
MALEKAFIPYGAYWSSPFCRWQGSLAHLNSVKLAADVARRFLGDRGIPAESLDGLILGITVPQRHSFYGAPWVAGMIGAPGISGQTIGQACATSARMLASAALEVEAGQRECILAVACDRTSNGPHIYYPNHKGTGGMGEAEDWVWDNFNKDPYAGAAMIATAENVAREAGITREEQDEIALLRAEQYVAALADDRAFQKSYMIPVELTRGKKVVGAVEADEGVHPTTADGLAKLRPMLEGGTVTFGSQTHPADGNAGLVVCSKERAGRLGRDSAVSVQLLSFGQARVKKGFMPMAVVPAAKQALDRAGVKVEDCAAIKTHNPFAVNDVYFCRETGVSPEKMNRFGSPLVWGHPQAPTGLRAIIEMIEELARAGGGVGLFSGCAAGDTAMAVVLKVG